MQGQVTPGAPGTPHTPTATGHPVTPGSGQGSNTGGSNVATAANIQVLAAQIPAVLTGIDMRRRDWPARRVARDKDEETQEEVRQSTLVLCSLTDFGSIVAIICGGLQVVWPTAGL